MFFSLSNRWRSLVFILLFCLSGPIAQNCQAEGAFVRSELLWFDCLGKGLSQPGVMLGVGSALSDSLSLVVNLSKSLGNNNDSYVTSVGIDPSTSQSVLLSETVKSLSVYSIEAEYKRRVNERISATASAGPALFQIDIEQAIRFGPGALTGAFGDGRIIPGNGKETLSGYGGIGRVAATYRIRESLRLRFTGAFFVGAYRRKFQDDELRSPSLQSTFSSFEKSETLSGLNFGLGLEFNF